MKKRFCACIAMVLLYVFCTGCSKQDIKPADANMQSGQSGLVGSIPVSFPLVSEPKSLNVLITGFNGKAQENVFVWQKYEEMTGVDTNWTTVTKETRSEKVHTALTNHQAYDLILRCKLSATKLLRYGKSGLVLDLAKDNLLQEYAPNCWAYLQSHPDALASVMNPDGTIYALPQVNSGAELRVGAKMYVNKLWLERLQLKLPTTTEELRALLLAFKEQDANGNGDPNDEIPMCADWATMKVCLYGAFGLQNRGMHNETMDCDPVTGKVRMIEACDQYKTLLAYVHGWYADGLMDKAMFDITLSQIMGNIANDKVGVFANTNLALLPADKAEHWVAIDEALTGSDGDQLWSGIRANFHSTGAAVIPTTCQNPALVLRWLDYFWTDAGTLFYHMGVEGETYQKLEDGSYDYLPKIYAEMTEKNISFDEAVSDYSPYPGGSNPTVEIAPYFMGGEMAEIPANAARSLIDYGPTEYWPSFTFTQEENDTLDGIKGDMRKYCDSMCVDFITGAQSLDAWDAYTAQVDAMGRANMEQVYQAAVDRYHALIASLQSDSDSAGT